MMIFEFLLHLVQVLVLAVLFLAAVVVAAVVAQSAWQESAPETARPSVPAPRPVPFPTAAGRRPDPTVEQVAA